MLSLYFVISIRQINILIKIHVTLTHITLILIQKYPNIGPSNPEIHLNKNGPMVTHMWYGYRFYLYSVAITISGNKYYKWQISCAVNLRYSIPNKFINNVRLKSIDHSTIMPILVEPTYPKISNLTPIGSRFLFSQYSNYFYCGSCWVTG